MPTLSPTRPAAEPGTVPPPTADPLVDDASAAPDLSASPDRPWVCIVWDDPINLMNYVTRVFMTVFGYPKAKAETLMLDVHEKGRAVVSAGTRERMELDTARLHGYGLWATIAHDS